MGNAFQSNNIADLINKADAVLIGAGSGLSTAAGHIYTGQRFYDNFSDFHSKYGMDNIYSGAFYPFETENELYAWWCRHIMINRYSEQESELYKSLLALVKDKPHFVLTTNADQMFKDNGFSEDKIFFTQGDYGLFQCEKPCHKKTYDNKEIIYKMYEAEKDMFVPDELIPKCPVCGGKMTVNLRKDDTFVEDEHWNASLDKYVSFVNEYEDKKLLFLELGVGYNTPGIIKYPFWKMSYRFENAFYVCVNMDKMEIPDELADKSLVLQGDIAEIIYSAEKNI